MAIPDVVQRDPRMDRESRPGIPPTSASAGDTQASPSAEAPEEEPEPHEDGEREDPPSEEHDPFEGVDTD